jgi:hypothetical protein
VADEKKLVQKWQKNLQMETGQSNKYDITKNSEVFTLKTQIQPFFRNLNPAQLS